MSNRGRIYGGKPERENRRVEVIHSTDRSGLVTPLVIVWADGRRFRIERVLDRRLAKSLKDGGEGLRYTVRIGHTDTYLWWDGTYWSVDAKVRAADEDWGC